MTNEISLSSSGVASVVMLYCLGQFDGESCSHGGPFYHNLCSNSSDGEMPLEPQSAGFSVPMMWSHLSGGIKSTLDETQLPT